MSDRDQSPVDALRQEEYVGENRCLPCTVVNTILGAVFALLGGAAARRVLGRTAGRLVTLVLAGVFAFLIYVRGYLVPGTPELTKRYLPRPVLKLFGKEPGTDTDDLAFGDQIDERIEADIAGEQADTDDTEPDKAGDQPTADSESPSDRTEVADTDSATVDDPVNADSTDAADTATDDEAIEIEITDADVDAASDAATDDTENESAEATTADSERDEETASDHEETAEADDPDWDTVDKVQYRREHSVDPEQFLDDVGAVKPCEDRDDVCLTDEFAAEIDEQLEAYDDRDDVDLELLGELFEESPDDIEPQDREYPTYKIGFRIRKWPTDGALFVDLATHEALRERSDDWLAVPLEQRVNILESLRSFLTVCPSCEGELRFSKSAVESCCGAHEVIAYKCLDCDQHLVELTPTKLGDGKTIEA